MPRLDLDRLIRGVPVKQDVEEHTPLEWAITLGLNVLEQTRQLTHDKCATEFVLVALPG